MPNSHATLATLPKFAEFIRVAGPHFLSIARTIFESEEDLCMALGAFIGVVSSLGPGLAQSEREFLALFLRRTADEIERGDDTKLKLQ